MKSKKGILLADETLKMVIAFICIVFLIYFLVALYFSRADVISMDQARRTLIDSPESIQKTIDAMKNVEARGFVLDNPAGWNLFSFTGDAKPNLCAGKNCLCICDKRYAATSVFLSQASKCDERSKGVCAPMENLEKQDISIPIETGITEISIQKVNNVVSITKK